MNAQGKRPTYSYDAADRRTVAQKADGFQTAMTYDVTNQEIGVIYANSVYVISRLTYRYDAASNRTGRISPPVVGRTTWLYDA